MKSFSPRSRVALRVAHAAAVLVVLWQAWLLLSVHAEWLKGPPVVLISAWWFFTRGAVSVIAVAAVLATTLALRRSRFVWVVPPVVLVAGGAIAMASVSRLWGPSLVVAACLASLLVLSSCRAVGPGPGP